MFPELVGLKSQPTEVIARNTNAEQLRPKAPESNQLFGSPFDVPTPGQSRVTIMSVLNYLIHIYRPFYLNTKIHTWPTNHLYKYEFF